MAKTPLPLQDSYKRDYWYVDSRRLIVDEEFNAREDYGDIQALADEIEAQGVTTPLKCYKKGEFYIVIRGHRRRLALKLLEEKGIFLMVPTLTQEKAKADTQEWVLDQITSNEGKPLTPLEQANVLRRLENFGWSEEVIIQRSGKSKVYVRQLLALAHAPQKLINAIRNGQVAGTEAISTIAEEKKRPGALAELIEKAEKGELSKPPANSELFPRENESARPQRITRSDLKRPPSYKKITKWISDVDEKGLSAKKLEVLQILRMICEGKFSKEYVDEYFG